MDERSPGIAALLEAALDRLAALAQRSEATSGLLQTWAPTVMALQKLGFTLFRVVNHLMAAATVDEVELMPAELADELRVELTELADAFPGVDHVIFGTETLDELIDAAVADESVSSAFRSAGRALATRFDRILEKLVGIAIDPESVGFSQSQLVGYLGGIERLLDKILDRWLADATNTS